MNDSKRLFDGALLSVALAAVLISVMAVIGMITRPDTVVVAADGGTAAPLGEESDEVRAHLTLSEFAIEGDLRVPGRPRDRTPQRRWDPAQPPVRRR